MAKQRAKAAKPAGRAARGARRKSAPGRVGRSASGAVSGRARGAATLSVSSLRPRFDEEPEPHASSATAVAAEALRTGVVPNVVPGRESDRAIPGEGRKMLVGDPDDDSLRNEYTGEDTPGGSTPTPDQNDVDEIGLAYGVKEEDSGELRTSAEVLDRRDRRRRGLAPGRRRS